MLNPRKEFVSPLVTVFGGSKCGRESAEYREGLKLGQYLAEAGYTVCTGGYSGVMEAVSRGAHEADGHVVGVTMSLLKAVPNEFVKETWPTNDFYNRLQKLIDTSVGYIALRGGMGTITEISLVWNKLFTRVLPSRPLILIGDCWPPVIDAFREHLVVGEPDLALIRCVPDAEEAVRVLENWNYGIKK